MKLRHLIVAALVGVLGSAQAYALNTLKKIQVTDGSRIDLLFDGKIDSRQIKTEFKNDIIQLSLDGVAVYPAKIHSVQGMDLTKVFAYQYTPKLTRCRFTVKGTAEDYKDRIEIKADGKILSFRIKPEKAAAVAAAADKASAAKDSAPKKSDDVEDKELLNKVLGKSGEVEKAGTAEASAKPLTSGKPLPSPLKPLGVLAGLLAMLAGLAILVKKGRKLENHKGFGRFMRGFSKLGIGAKSRMIEVIQTHHLGPKRSISVVKVAGRTLVLGITNESINLIAQLDGNAGSNALDQLGEEIAQGSDETSGRKPGATFDQLLMQSDESSLIQALNQQQNASQARATAQAQAQASRAVIQSQAGAQTQQGQQAPVSKPSIRAQIRSRLEGMKQL